MKREIWIEIGIVVVALGLALGISLTPMGQILQMRLQDGLGYFHPGKRATNI